MGCCSSKQSSQTNKNNQSGANLQPQPITATYITVTPQLNADPAPSTNLRSLRTLNLTKNKDATRQPIEVVQGGGSAAYNSERGANNQRTAQKNGSGRVSLISGNINKQEVDDAQNIVGGTPKVPKKRPPTIFFDIGPPQKESKDKKEQIYRVVVSNQNPLSKPYSTLSDWQSLVTKNISMTEDELVGKILNLRNRNWLLEQIKLQNEAKSQSPQSLDSLLISRRILQLREQFNWLTWALAHFYFFFNGQSSHYSQFQNGVNHQPSSNQGNNDVASINTSVTGISTQAIGRPLLPKVGSKVWNDGFEYKGVYVRVLPYEDAKFIRNEIKALRFVQTELLELKTLAKGNSKTLQGLHEEVCLPLIAGVSFGGFYFYATPIIYLPKSLCIEDKLQKEFSHVRDLLRQTSPQSLNYSPSPQALAELNEEDFSQKNLHHKLIAGGDCLTKDSTFKYMPTLKHLTCKNMIPIYDYEQYPQPLLQHNIQPDFQYILFDLYGCLPSYNEDAGPAFGDINQIMMRIPSQPNDDITYFRLSNHQQIQGEGGCGKQQPQYLVEARDLKRLILNGTIPRSHPNLSQKIPSMLFMSQKKEEGESGDMDIYADEYQNLLALEEDEENKKLGDGGPEDIIGLFQKRTFSKHGWEFTMITKKNVVTSGATLQQPLSALQISSFNENKRASNLFNSRELKMKGSNSTQSVQALNKVVQDDVVQEEQVFGSPRREGFKMQVVQMEEFNMGDQTLDFSAFQIANNQNPPITSHLSGRFGLFTNFRGQQEANSSNQENVDSSHLLGAMPMSNNLQPNRVFGTVLVTAKQYRKDMKIQYCLTSHQMNHNQNLEILINASMDQVVQVLEKADKIFDGRSLQDLMLRKGLNKRFSWGILPKLRQNWQRELVMIDILMRVIRKIINEEIKIKTLAVSNQLPQQMIVAGHLHNDHQSFKVSNQPTSTSQEEYCQGGGIGQTDTYREILVFFMNTLLKKKMNKYRHIFDEAILGLVLSRSEFLGLISQINLKKEEYNYLESKDILEDILEVPSKNPTLFINQISSYFKIEFTKEFLRFLRQDKFTFLAKTQPICKQDILKHSCRNSLTTYFTLKDEAYFILAKQINKSQQVQVQVVPIIATTQQNSFKGALQSTIQNNSNPPATINQIPGKIKTKSDKDRLAQSHHTRNQSNNMNFQVDQMSMRSSIVPIDQNNNLNISQSLIESNEIHNNSSRLDQFSSRNKQQPVLHDFRQPKDSLSTIRQYQNMEAIINESPLFAQDIDQIQQMDFSKISKRNNQFKPTQPSEIVLPSIFYKMKTSSQSNPLYYFDDASKPYNGETLSIFRPIYEMPNQDIIDEWTIVMESLLKDMATVNGSDQVLLEAFVYEAIQIYFYKNGDSDELFKVLQKIRDALFLVSFCSPETLVMIQILTGLYFEEKRDQTAIEAEKSYLTAMICFFQIYGDPRGRGNFSVPYNLFLSWKLSLLSLAEDKKVHDSEYAEEIFDATLRCLPNHKSVFKEQQLQNASSANMLFGGSKQGIVTGGSSLPTEVMGQGANQTTHIEKTAFEIQLAKSENQRRKFDMKKYRAKPFNVTYASGMYRSNFPNVKKPPQLQQAAMNVYITVNHHYNNNKELKGGVVGAQDVQLTDQHQIFSNDIFKSKSQIIVSKNLNGTIGEKRGGEILEINHNQYDLEPSEIDLEIEDENKNFLLDENFNSTEYSIGVCPFQHWSLYRQQIMQILQAHNLHRNNPVQNQYQKQIYRDMLQKFLPKDLFFQWLLRFNPMMYQSGVQWSNQQIRDYIFCQPHQQMISSSSSSVVMSNHNLSHHSMISGLSIGGGSMPTSTAKEKQRQVHLGTYSQILGKEVGGISKQEMHGVLYAMGTDGYGQLGLEAITAQSKETQSISLKVLYPRMVLSLRDEMIKEVFCGHCHTFAINIHGQVFAWGLNESSQLGLGPEAPPTVRRPVLNLSLKNITKMSAGNEHSLAINKQGDLFVWGGGGLTGFNDMNPRNIPTKLDFFNSIKIQQAICGGLHTLVLTKDGEVYSWGSTEGGQLGLPLNMLQESIAQEIPVLVPQRIPKLEGINIIQVACGEAHSIAMSKDGNIYGWGMSNYGQLGLGFSADSFEPGIGMEKSKVPEPTEIQGLKNERITKIICGSTFSLFHTEKGELFGCGMNDLGQLGLDTFMEEIIINQKEIDPSKKGRHTIASSDITVPTRVICFQGIGLHNIACGENHALAVSGDDRNMLWAWGMYRQGQLGLGEVTMKMNPRPVQNLCSSTIQKLACGSMHSLVLLGDQQQLQTVYQQYFAAPNNFDVLSNHWICDIRQLGQKVTLVNQAHRKNSLFNNNNDLGTVEEGDNVDLNQRQSKNWTTLQPHLNDGRENVRGRDDEVTEDAEGKVKNPK